MSDKTVHIVFQVINFIYSQYSAKYNLLPNDKLLLINLAKHKGNKGIFPSQETIANELNLSIRYVRERLQYLQDNGLILIKKMGRRHSYELLELGLIEELQFPYQESIEELQFRSQRNPSSGHSGTTAATNNRVNNRVNNRERRTQRAHPLPDDFEHTAEHEVHGQSLHLTDDEFFTSLDKFKAHHKSNRLDKCDWNAEFNLWLSREAEFKSKRGGQISKPQGVKSIIPEYERQHNAIKRSDIETSKHAMAGIMAKLGVSINGISHTERGRKKKD